MKIYSLGLLSALTAALFTGVVDAAIIVDAVLTNTGASIDRTLTDGVTVTGANLSIVQPGNPNVDPTAAAWGGNLFTYVIDDLGTDAPGGGLGNVTYVAAAGNYFQDFDARIIGNTGQVGGQPSDVLARFTFEGSTDGILFAPIAMTGVVITGAGLDADWTRVSATPTDLSSLGQVTHLRIGMQPKTPGGDWWHQQFGAVNLDQTPVPEPASLALLGLGGLCLMTGRRR